MRFLVEKLFGRRAARQQRSGPARHRQASSAPPQRTGGAYRSKYCLPMDPAQVRSRRFGRTRIGRRGLDPEEVRTFLERVALELAAAHDATARARRETERIKDALRRWQSEQARTRDVYATYR